MTAAPTFPISHRVQGIKSSATLAVGTKAAELRAQGVDVIPFGAGEPDFDTPQPIIDAAKRALDAGLTHYAPVPGDPKARAAIADKLERENHIAGLSPDHVIISPGAKQSLYLAFQAILDTPTDGSPGRDVLVPVPAWVSYRPQIELSGGRMVELPTTADSDFKITPDQLKDAINPNTAAVLFNSPSNPCGTMYTPDELRALGGVIAEAANTTAPDIRIITDEIYEKLTFGGLEHFSLGSIPELAERTITINGLSKSYAMTGWRVGYLASPGDAGKAFVNACKKMQSQLNTCIPQFIYPAIGVALSECHDHVEAMRREFESRAELMRSELAKIDGLIAPTPTGAFYAFCDISSAFGKRTPKDTEINNAVDFAAALLAEHHVALVPGDDFGGVGNRCVRLTFAADTATITEGVRRLGAFMASLR